jgi:hypothetical protein
VRLEFTDRMTRPLLGGANISQSPPLVAFTAAFANFQARVLVLRVTPARIDKVLQKFAFPRLIQLLTKDVPHRVFLLLSAVVPHHHPYSPVPNYVTAPTQQRASRQSPSTS